MARDISKRLAALKARRAGTDRLSALAASEQATVVAKSAINESYQKRAQTQPYTRYSLGSMQEVSAEYTRISIETAERVAKQLIGDLTPAFSLEFALQGSVPANIHIRGVSDVDLLVLDTAFFTYDRYGPNALAGYYRSPISYTPVSALMKLRANIETTLKARYPSADVDTKGSKAVSISGGSLARPVDVVPSHWHNTADYQRTASRDDRGVCILNKSVPETIENMPFRHIARITARDTQALRSLKKAIRLCKHIKNDAIEEGTEIALPSFDIAAAMYHANIAALQVGAGYELAVLAETQRHLDALTMNEAWAKTLDVPDGSRKIFDTEAKLRGLRALSLEVDDLAREVAKEQSPTLGLFGIPSLLDSRTALGSVYIPDIAA
jgi:hypothetical protein